jgi:hypothetical protein
MSEPLLLDNPFRHASTESLFSRLSEMYRFANQAALNSVYFGEQQVGIVLRKLIPGRSDEGMPVSSRNASVEDQMTAADTRSAWMRLMGLPEDEIAENCRLDPANPLDLAEELRELDAAKRLQQSGPTYGQLLGWSRGMAK